MPEDKPDEPGVYKMTDHMMGETHRVHIKEVGGQLNVFFQPNGSSFPLHKFDHCSWQKLSQRGQDV